MTYYVYQIFNTLNGKMYIGKTNDFSRRFKDHIRVAEAGKEVYGNKFTAIHAAIAKYNSALEFSIMQNFSTEQDAFNAEIYWIKYFNSNNHKFGYNLTTGGEGSSGFKLSPEHKAKLITANTGRTVSESTRLKTSKSVTDLNQKGEKNPNASLTNEKANMIRDMYASGNYNQTQLGLLFHIDQTTVSLIINNKRYTG